MAEFKTIGNSKAENLRLLRKLTEREKEAALTMWKDVEKRYPEFGRLVFVNLFEDHPSFKNYFMEILGDYSDPFSNLRFQRHMLQVLLPTIGGILTHIDHPDAVYEAVKRLGVNHRKKELGLRRENIETLAASMLKTIRTNIKTMTQEQSDVIDKLFLIIMDIFSNGLEGKTS